MRTRYPMFVTFVCSVLRAYHGNLVRGRQQEAMVQKMKKPWRIWLRSSWLLLFHLLIMGADAGRVFSWERSDGEVASLLAFKQSSVKSDPGGFLAGWVPDSPGPCSWRGVSCSRDGSIIAIDLVNAGLTGRLHLPYLTGGLPNLQRLSLQKNYFSVGNFSAGAGSPCVLESLDLSSNNLADPIPDHSVLLSCDRLNYVNLSGNSIPGGILRFGSSLQQLDVSRNKISNPSLINRALSNCSNLNFLNFSANKLSGQLDASLSSRGSLSALDLSCNLLSGEIPPKLIGESSIKFLDLSQNNFTGDLVAIQFGRCSNLSLVNFSQNRLSGSTFHASLSNCNLLETLDLSHNQLRSTIPGDLLGSLKSLKKLSLGGNQLTGEIPSSLARACGTLSELDLSKNSLSGELPASFVSCSHLQTLNLGRNELSGDFLSTVVSKLTGLRFLSVPFNNISGPVPLPLTHCSNLQALDLSSNAFTGEVPPGFCSSTDSTALERIILANNHLSGSVPSVLRNCRNLRSIDLSFNALTGPIPKEIVRLPKITDLVLWANNLSGTIPEDICVHGGNLEMLILNNNLLTGTIPQSIASCPNMIWMSISSNQLTGEIPAGIGNLVNLAILQMGNNSLTGGIPRELGNCRSLIWLDLNSNNLMGPLPGELAANSGLVMAGNVSGKQFAFVRNEGRTSCRGAGGLVEFEGISADQLQSLPMVRACPSTRIYSGLAFYTFVSNGSMIYLDLSYNLLSGMIPARYGAMSYLQVLNLGHNKLTGAIPESLGDLRAVGVMDLSHNNLQGSIPASMGALSFLNDFDVSNNNLSGAIPSGGQLTTFPPSRYANNTRLCNLPLDPCESRSLPPSSTHQGKNNSFEMPMIIGIAFFVFCITGLMVALYGAKKHQREAQMREKYTDSLPNSGAGSWKPFAIPHPLSINVTKFEKPLQKLTYAHLLEATNGFSADSLIGTGGFGEVYKARLKDGCSVAVKKLIHITAQGDREFMAEMETIGKIKHRNLVPLLGYCKVGDERLLVYEFMKWGSLEAALHDRTAKGGGSSSLGWAARKRIAVGSARGLAFLHHSCIPRIIHRDMKSSNVLLDENFEARVSDFGMARLVNAFDTHLSVSTLAGTPGYVPPEYYQSFRCTTKGDVYSYGVVLLELLSGKRPIGTSEFGEDNNLVGWAKQLQREKRSTEILDPQLVTGDVGEGELVQYLGIAFACLEDRPFRRLTMIQVMSMFKGLEADSVSDVLDGISAKDIVVEETREREAKS